ncbi:hypothetical protein E4K64_30930 [Bradyrhizobium frederickii]|uniref:Uncharacterized protein n=1 Tax=Bradyrhizobium frederickii TaxID=2560054 RepID=A0A4Y9NTE5_9BRAD|nr:hypothetical protein E4K64_30930 [Bradyrhizobium frederickii]
MTRKARHPGMVRRTRPGISRFRVRVSDAPRNDSSYTPTSTATPITISTMPKSSRGATGCLNE